MTDNISLPVWLFILLAALAALAIIEYLLLPGVRWFVRRRVNRVVTEMNRHLRLKIKPFKLTKRQVLIDRLIYDPEVMKAVEERLKEEDAPRDALMADVRRYAKEIVPAFNAYFYFRIGCWIAQKVAQSIYRVRLGYVDEKGHALVPEDSSVVFLMNHRSNMDYILISYLVASRTTLSYAVGEWARIWPLQTLIRAMGAYFIRRRSGDPIYRKVLERYVFMATRAGVVQAVYPEGGLSRSGTLLEPRLGLLGYVLRSFDPGGERDLVFLPVGVNYDRVLEDRSLILEGRSDYEQKSTMFVLKTTVGFLAHNFWLTLRRKWHRLGYACVNFGAPFSMKEYVAGSGLDFQNMEKEEFFREVESLGKTLMEKVGEVVPVLPVSVISTVFLRNQDRGMTELEIKSRTHELIEELEEAGAHVYMPRGSEDYAVTVGLRMLTLRHIVVEEEGHYSARSEETPLLQYYANSIIHLMQKHPAHVS